MTSIFYCLISYVYCLVALAATWWASFLSHLTSFVYCLLFWGRVSIVCPQPSYDFISSAAVLIIIKWKQQQLWCLFTTNAAAVCDVTGFCHMLRCKVWKLRLSRSNLWSQIRNSSGRYAAGLIFMLFGIRFLFYFVWNLTFNNLNHISKIWRLKTDVIDSSTCTWDLETYRPSYKS